MSGKLVREVLEYAPEDLTPAQLVVLLSLAEDARDNERVARYHTSLVELQRRTRLARGTLKNTLGVLVARGLISPLHRAQIGTVQHYRLAQLDVYHRGAVTTPREESG